MLDTVHIVFNQPAYVAATCHNAPGVVQTATFKRVASVVTCCQCLCMQHRLLRKTLYYIIYIYIYSDLEGVCVCVWGRAYVPFYQPAQILRGISI